MVTKKIVQWGWGGAHLNLNHRGCDRMVVGYTTTYVFTISVPIITKVVSLNPTHGEVYSTNIDF